MTSKEMTVQKKEAKSLEHTTPEKFYLPATDILEYEDKLVLHMDMPGVQKENVQIHVEEDTLQVESSFNPDKYKELKPLFSEYNVGPYTRSFTLSTKIDKTQIEAKMENGTLSITLPKKVELSRQISIK